MNYSQGNYKQLNRLFYLSTISIAVFLSLLIAPMVIWMPDILKIWLGDADAMTVVFSRIMLVVASAYPPAICFCDWAIHPKALACQY